MSLKDTMSLNITLSFLQSYRKKRTHASFRATTFRRSAKRKAIGFAYSLKRSRTRMSRASAMVCKRHSEGSLRPLQNCLMAWGDMPNCFANSTQLMFFPSLLFADSTATHTLLFSLCLFLKLFILIAPPPSLAVRLRLSIELAGPVPMSHARISTLFQTPRVPFQ